MEWYGYVGLGIVFYLLTFAVVRIVVNVMKRQNKDSYRSEYYGR